MIYDRVLHVVCHKLGNSISQNIPSAAGGYSDD